jgi:hypothetical protein
MNFCAVCSGYGSARSGKQRVGGSDGASGGDIFAKMKAATA